MNSNLKEMFETKQAGWQADEGSEEFELWKEEMIHLIPKLQFDSLIELALYLSFESKVNHKYIWKEIENSVLENLHLYELKHVCQLQWAVTQLKPKYTSSNFDKQLF